MPPLEVPKCRYLSSPPSALASCQSVAIYRPPPLAQVVIASLGVAKVLPFIVSPCPAGDCRPQNQQSPPASPAGGGRFGLRPSGVHLIFEKHGFRCNIREQLVKTIRFVWDQTILFCGFFCCGQCYLGDHRTGFGLLGCGFR